MSNPLPECRKILLSISFCLIVSLLVFSCVNNSHILKTFDLVLTDWQLRVFSRPVLPDKDVVVILVDDKTVSTTGYPLNRKLYADLLRGLSGFKPKAIGFDIVFSSAALSPADKLLVRHSKQQDTYYPIGFSVNGHRRYTEAEKAIEKSSFGLQDSRNLIDGVSIALCPFPQLIKSAKGIGHINIIPDIDGKVRRLPLLIRYNQRCYPFLGLALAGEYLGMKPEGIKADRLIFGNINIPVNERCEMLIPRVEERVNTCSLIDVLQSIKAVEENRKPLLSPLCFKGKIVLIGVTASGAGDLCSTPFVNIENMINLHANVIQTILAKRFIQEVSPWIVLLITICLGIIIGLGFPLLSSPVSRVVFALGLIIGYVLAAIILIRYGNILASILPPVLTVILTSIVIFGYQYIREKKRLLCSLEEMAGFNENIINNMSNGLIVIDFLHRIQKINDVALRMMGEGMGSLIGRDAMEIFPAGMKEEVEYTWREKKGRENRNIITGNRHLEVNTSLLKDTSGREGVIILMNDITLVKQLEEKTRLNERLADIGIMVAKVGHEIGNSLTPIILFAENLKEMLDDHNSKMECVNEIIDEAKMMLRKISELKDYSKPVQLHLQPVDINSLLEGILRKIPANQVEIRQDLGTDLPQIMIDPDQLEGVFMNLIINAIQAMPGSGILGIGTRVSGEMVEVTISDTGSGIPPEVQGKIFTPFFTTKTRIGTGLGLAIVHKIITTHQGSISFRTESSKGTVFSVQLPVRVDLL